MPVSSRLAAGAAAAGAVATAAAALWWRAHPSACPYGQRFWVQAPHPFITRAKLQALLDPRPGERLLEVGPGTGYYTLPVAERLGEHGELHLLDLQPEMLDHTTGRAARAGITNLVPRQGDATHLPYPDHHFDGAYLTAVLGEVPDQDAALSELRRVLKPQGRLVVGELFGDPHWVSPGRLRRQAEKAGLRAAGRSGGLIGSFSRFVPEDAG